MTLTRNFLALPGLPNEINLNWDQPEAFNNSTDELVIARTGSHYPSELENTTYPNSSTDNRPIEIYRASVTQGTSTSTTAGNLTDSSANFPIAPKLIGRLVRDCDSKVYRILDNTSTELTLDTTETSPVGPYVILADFPKEAHSLRSFAFDVRTEVGAGYVKDLVTITNGQLVLVEFVVDELANLIHVDGAGVKRVIKSNTEDTVYFFDVTTPYTSGVGTSILNSFAGNTLPLPYVDSFNTDLEAGVRIGSGLIDNKYYYYTAFNQPEGTNVAQAKFSSIDSIDSTQTSAISVKDRDFGTLLYNYWPGIVKDLDTTEDIKDLMSVFGSQMQENHAIIDSFKLQDTYNVHANALPALADQTGLPTIGSSIGVDTLRRIAKDMIPCWHLKGSKEGIGVFIRKITTWDITDGTGDWAGAIADFLPNIEALRLFAPSLGSTNTRMTQTDPTVVSGGRFARSLPGIVIPGFFTFREFVVTLPNVAMLIGTSETITISNGTTTIVDNSVDYGVDNGLVGNFLLPNEEEINDIFEIISNTSNSVTVKGAIINKTTEGSMIVLSPLNKDRFVVLHTLLPSYIPFGTKAGFLFTIT